MSKQIVREVISLEDVTEDLVIEYLCTHPEFFQVHEDILESLQVSHPCGSAVSLIERQVELLRDKHHQLQLEVLETTQIAKANEALFQATKRLTLALIAANDIESLLHCLMDQLRYDFQVDQVQIGLMKFPKEIIALDMVYSLKSSQASVVLDLIKLPKPSCQPLKKRQREFLFGSVAKKIGSAAVVPLGVQGSVGLMALGSYDRDHFHRDMDTLFLDYIGKIVSEILLKNCNW